MDIVASAGRLAGAMAGHSVRLAAVGARAAVSVADRVIETADGGGASVWETATGEAGQPEESQPRAAEDDSDFGNRARHDPVPVLQVDGRHVRQDGGLAGGRRRSRW